MIYAEKVLNAGKPVYVEKPMGVSVEECEKVMKLAKEKHLPIFVAYYRRSLPYFHKIKEILDSGKLGAVRQVNICQYTKAPSEDVYKRQDLR